jgi:hypothetical protein
MNNPTKEQLEKMFLNMFNLDLSKYKLEEIYILRDLLNIKIKKEYGKK